MASLGHIAVGMAAARVHGAAASRWRPMVLWSALSLLPDADVIGFPLGVEYGDPWGHRGATHSLTFAFVVAAAVALVAARLGRASRRLWWIASAVLASHGLLDTLTDGGLGCALLWPFDLTRYFAPWRPIPVSQIGLFFFTLYGLRVVATELVLFAPVLVYALRLRRLARPSLLAVWGVSVWLIVSGDPLRERVIGFLLREDTEFAGGFSHQQFDTIREGESADAAQARLPAPIGIWWDYRMIEPGGCLFVYFEKERVGARADQYPSCFDRGIREGMSRDDVQRELGQPDSVCWRLSRSPTRAYHRARVVCFADGKVEAIVRSWERR